MKKNMKELNNIGEKIFFGKVEDTNKPPTIYSERIYNKPTYYEIAKLTLRKIHEKAKKKYDDKFYIDQWILMFCLKKTFASSLWMYKKIMPPKDRYWADPHIIFIDNKYYIFIEEYIYNKKKGHISLLIMDGNGVYSEPEIILVKSYHLSYPFVFEYEKEFYMIPESKLNNNIQLYKCVEFPYKWEFQTNLMENVRAVDSTVLFNNGTWWMFANIADNIGVSTWDKLFLFSSSDLFNDNWKPHPLNPIVSDIRTARPAGKIFSKNGRLYRPSQNCFIRYGYGLNINEITALDEFNYSEVVVSSVVPNWDKNIIGTHTFNHVNNLHMIDALYKRRKY